MEAMLSSILKFSRIAGLFPFNDKFQWSYKWLIYSLLIQLLYIPLMINVFLSNYYYIISLYRIRSMGVLIILNWITMLLSFFSNLFTIYHLTRKRGMVFKVFDNLDKEISRCSEFPKTRFYTAYISMSFSTLACIFWAYFLDSDYKETNISHSLLSLLLSSSTISMASQLWDLMRLLTILLQETTKRYDEGSVSALERMTTYGESMSEIYGPFIFIMVMTPFFELIFHSYMLLLPAYPGSFELNSMLLSFILLCFVRLGLVAYSCCSFLDQIQWFNDKLHWKILNDKTGRYSNNEMFFFHFIAYKKTKFSACGFFDIDYTLIGTMISVCTTYLVIVLQYGQGSQS
ncbi:Gustatory receptor 104b [Halyomorpha halys]|nr:Gustatory receptor 104b [Halyomorpha halys]